MALSHSPKIVRNGLVLCLDAANPRSYPGSGNVWNDLSGNGNHGTLVNGVGYSTSNFGYFTQDNIDDHISTNYILPVSNFTITTWARRTSNVYWSVLWANEIWNNGSGYVVNFTTTNTLYFQKSGGNQLNPTTVSNSSNWSYYSFTVDINSNFRVYYNGILLNSYTSTLASNVENTIKIGTRHANNNAGFTDRRFGEYSFFSVYNRVLTAPEIRQNFEATRDRYGV
jgi:hypothetical protein